jgi:transposase InsO family protein
MSRNGSCWVDAVSEGFFGVLKNEPVHDERFQTRQKARDKIIDNIEVFYTMMRIHRATNYLARAEYEAHAERIETGSVRLKKEAYLLLN